MLGFFLLFRSCLLPYCFTGTIEHAVLHVLSIFSTPRVNPNAHTRTPYKVSCNIHRLARSYNVMFEVILFANISIALTC